MSTTKSVKNTKAPSFKKTLSKIDGEELDKLGDPKVYNKLSDKNKALYHLRCYISPNVRISLPRKNDTVSVKQFYSHMNMLGEHSFGCLVTIEADRVFAKRVKDYAYELALTGFTDACGAMGFVLDPNREEFKAYPKYVQKWLSQMLRSTAKK